MDLLSLIKHKKVLILDGATGTQLAQRGAPAGGRANIEAPDTVTAVHRAYIDAGSDCVITNSFCMNRVYMKANNFSVSVSDMNARAAELARKAAGDRALVLGGFGPTGELLKPVGNITEAECEEAFAEQARALADAGVDAFIVETMMDMNEAACAVRACKRNFKLPVIASMTYATTRDGGRTTMGHRAGGCARILAAAGADILSCNCGDLDPAETAIIVSSYKNASDLPVLVEPNAGKPVLDDNNNAVYSMPPAEFAQGVLECIRAGASLAGGCCGTTPDHIRALAEMAASL